VAIGAWLIVGVLVWTRVGGAGDRAEALEAGWMRLLACRRLELRERRANRWLPRRDAGRLADGKPGGGPLHAIPAEESEAILALFEEVGQVDRSRRKLARRGSYLGRFWCFTLDGGSSASIGGQALPAHSAPGQVGPDAIPGLGNTHPELDLDL
jgi:hypothetical protein